VIRWQNLVIANRHSVLSWACAIVEPDETCFICVNGFMVIFDAKHDMADESL
jgi:hypothetical protein